jgi:hypothetical protein
VSQVKQKRAMRLESGLFCKEHKSLLSIASPRILDRAGLPITSECRHMAGERLLRSLQSSSHDSRRRRRDGIAVCRPIQEGASRPGICSQIPIRRPNEPIPLQAPMASRLHQTIAEAPIPSGETLSKTREAEVGTTELDQGCETGSMG